MLHIEDTLVAQWLRTLLEDGLSEMFSLSQLPAQAQCTQARDREKEPERG